MAETNDDTDLGSAEGTSKSRSWREFSKEVGIIVLGVLIALVVGEVADAVRLRVEARRSMDAVRADLIDNSATFEIAARFATCSQKRLDELARELERSRKDGRLRDIGEIGRIPTTSLRTNSWDSAVANRNVLFLDQAIVAELSDQQDSLRSFRLMIDESALDWARLSVLSGAPGPLDDNTYAMAKQTIAELRYRTRMIGVIAGVILGSYRRLQIPIVYTPYNGIPQNRETTFRRIDGNVMCRPLSVT